MENINIQKICGSANMTKCSRVPEYIAIHFTANSRSDGDQAKNIANMFNNSSRGASADFIVDDRNIVQYNPDVTKNYCWAVGGSLYAKKYTSQAGVLYKKAMNKNVVSIELVSSKKSTKTMNDTDTDWYFTNNVIQNGVQITKHLMQQYNIPIDRVIMHHHVTGKLCPAMWCNSEKALSGWNEFKSLLAEKNEPVIQAKDFELRNYITTQDAYLRKDVSASSLSKVKFSTLSDSLKKKCSEDKEGYAKFLSGYTFTLTETKAVSGNIWGKIKSGYWLPLYYNEKLRVK